MRESGEAWVERQIVASRKTHIVFSSLGNGGRLEVQVGGGAVRRHEDTLTENEGGKDEVLGGRAIRRLLPRCERKAWRIFAGMAFQTLVDCFRGEGWVPGLLY